MSHDPNGFGSALLTQSAKSGANPILSQLGFSPEQIETMSSSNIQKLLTANNPHTRRKFFSRVTLKLASANSAPAPPPVPQGP